MEVWIQENYYNDDILMKIPLKIHIGVTWNMSKGSKRLKTRRRNSWIGNVCKTSQNSDTHFISRKWNRFKEHFEEGTICIIPLISGEIRDLKIFYYSYNLVKRTRFLKRQNGLILYSPQSILSKGFPVYMFIHHHTSYTLR